MPPSQSLVVTNRLQLSLASVGLGLCSGCPRLKQGHGTHHTACPRSVSGPVMPMGKHPSPPAGLSQHPTSCAKGTGTALSACLVLPVQLWRIPRQIPAGTHNGAPIPGVPQGQGRVGTAPQVSTVPEAPSPTSSPSRMGRDGLGVLPFWANQDPSELALAEVTAPQCLWQ